MDTHHFTEEGTVVDKVARGSRGCSRSWSCSRSRSWSRSRSVSSLQATDAVKEMVLEDKGKDGEESDGEAVDMEVTWPNITNIVTNQMSGFCREWSLGGGHGIGRGEIHVTVIPPSKHMVLETIPR